MDISYRLNLEKTAKHLNENDYMLDFACATGLYTVEFSNAVSKIDALDISPKMIAHAEQKAMEKKLIISLSHAQQYSMINIRKAATI